MSHYAFIPDWLLPSLSLVEAWHGGIRHVLLFVSDCRVVLSVLVITALDGCF
jgi:hypothetical protein